MAHIRTDVVTITFRRSSVTGFRIIQSVRIIGSTFPCRRFLVVGRRVLFAQLCLLSNRFRLVSSSRNVLVFVRRTGV
jgi:site-specific DNA-cytosine methylase